MRKACSFPPIFISGLMECLFVLQSISSKQSKEEIKKIISLIVASKRTKYLEMNLNKEMPDFCTKNCKRLLKGNEEDLNGKIFLFMDWKT